eukprot:symbB.v1.2.012960.t1/scaffold906.1/size153294/5
MADSPHPVPAVHFEMPNVPETEPTCISIPAQKKNHLRSSETPVFYEAGQLSEPFQRLLEQLVDQHLAELAEREPKVTVESQAAPEKGIAGGFMSFLTTGRSRTVSTVASTVLSSRKRQLREVEANEVLTALDSEGDLDSVEELEQKFRTTEQIVANVLAQSDTKAVTELGEDAPCSDRWKIFMQSSKYEVCIASVMILNVLWMALELQVYGYFDGEVNGLTNYTLIPLRHRETVDGILAAGDMFFAAMFVLDVVSRVLLLGCKFWGSWINYLDVMVTIGSIVEIVIFLLPLNAVFFRLVRFGKLARTLRMMTMTSILSSLQLLTKCLTASIDMLFWTFCLLTFMQCVAGLAVSTLCRSFLIDNDHDIETRKEIFKYYGTFTRSLLTMFEVLFANWGPPCRLLVDNISEWFTMFFLLYRCVVGFAVLNVVSAVFVQQTMKMANSDEELAFRQKEKETASYARKVRKLFQHMDDSGDGALSLDEFAKLVQSPKLKFWMSQLELEYHDLLSLFEFMDNGDGQITLTEFIEGSTRLRGSAKALDVWRLETKVEVLFEEILKSLHKHNDGDISSHVRAAFKNSPFKHIVSASKTG